mmetsp:Transcript_32457/g.55527  ORF Transcript_32457/g.55527 Transcript_32457/m.55527 type:complete len:564 (+) Transcript_32457:74-1765(+)
MTFSPGASQPTNGFATVVVDYDARRPAELTLKVGDRVKVTKQGPTNWIGTLNGKVGSFPASCVTLERQGGAPVSHRPTSAYTPAASVIKKPNAPNARAHSNYTPSSAALPPPVQMPTNVVIPKAFPSNLPPPPSSIVSGGGGKTGVRNLPKFSDVAGDLDEPTAPPRSPRRDLTISDLPPIPPRDAPVVLDSPKDNTPSIAPPTNTESAPGTPEIKKRSKDELRKECITEIYETEKAYIDDLETMINVFIFPLRTMKIATEQVLYNIFSNLEVLIHCNEEMLKELEQVIDAKTGAEVQIGEVFTKLADYFKMYKVYCANQQNSLTTVEQQTKKNSEFKKNLDVCHSDPRCKGLFLQSYLIKPIQRVCKYPLLLRELIRYTPEDHPDYQPLQNAFLKINEVVANINEGQRQAEGLQRIIDLQKLIDGVDTLVAPNRNLQKEGDLDFYKSSKSKHPEKRHVFFFSDLILLTIKKGEKKFEHKLSVPLENCTLTVLADSSYIKNSFELVQGEKKHQVKCILGCDTKQECSDWVKNIKGLIKEYQKRKFSELKKLQDQGLTPISSSG